MDNNLKRWETLDDIIEHWSKENAAMELLRENEITEADSIEDIEHYENGDDRKGIVYHVREKGKNTIKKVLIDIKTGGPSTEQVYEAVYGMGKDCDKRIIVYAGGNNKNDDDNPAADEYVVYNLIDVMNDYPLHLNLFHIGEDPFSLKEYMLCYPIEQTPKYKITDLPAEIQIRFEEFWVVLVDSFAEAWHDPVQAFSGNFRDTSDWGYMLYVESIADLPGYWTESGIIFTVKQTSDSHDHLKTLWDATKKELKERYGAENVDFEYVLGKLPKIMIKYSDKPLEWLMNATPREKSELGKKVYYDMWELRRFLEKACEECNVPVHY